MQNDINNIGLMHKHMKINIHLDAQNGRHHFFKNIPMHCEKMHHEQRLNWGTDEHGLGIT